jgi:hypothetical protein
MLLSSECRSVSLYPSPRVIVTLGRVASSSAEGELGERVRILTSYFPSLVSSVGCEMGLFKRLGRVTYLL